MRNKRLMVAGLVGLAAACVTSLYAEGALPYGTLTAYSGSGWGSGYGSLNIQATTRTNTAYVMANALNGKPVYTEGEYWNASNSFILQSNRSAAEYYVNVSRSNTYTGSTAAPWYGKAKVCIDISLSPDKCSAYSPSGRIS